MNWQAFCLEASDPCTDAVAVTKAVRQAERGMFRQKRFSGVGPAHPATDALQSQALRLDLSRVCFPGASPSIREKVS